MTEPAAHRWWQRDPDASLRNPDIFVVARVAAILTWAIVFLKVCLDRGGVPYLRTDLLFWLATGLLAWSIGQRRFWIVVLDFLPFALVLIAYDHLRGIADTMGMPTWWHPQLDVDKALFGGRVPTIWLQEHLHYPGDLRWWDDLFALTYASFFFLPYVTAAVLWLRNRAQYRRWAARFVSLSFLGFGLFALVPSAPPWAAARCSAAQVANHPSNPSCINGNGRADNGLLGELFNVHTHSLGYVSRMSTQGLSELHLHLAGKWIQTGQYSADRVAAVPSLHAGGIMLFTIFMWPRVNRFWKTVLVIYNPLMMVALAYGAEHYVSDVLAGWLCAALVCVAWNRIERWWAKRKAPADTLDTPPQDPEGAETCPPTVTTPSSI